MTRLLDLLGLRRSEVPRLAHAALVFFLVSLGDGLLKSVAAAVFNVRAGVDKLPLMYTWIAVLFSLSMALLSFLSTRIPRQRLLVGLLGALGAVLCFNAAVLLLEHRRLLGPAPAGFYPFLFISSEMVRSLAGFQLWIVAGGICYSSRARVLFPLLASSATLGDIAGGFAVRGLGSMLASYQLYGLAALNMLLVLALLRALIRRYFVAGDGEAPGATLGENARYFAHSTYLKLLFALSIAVFALYTSIHYGFNVVGRRHFPSEAEFTGFFGLFYGLTGVATLGVTTFLLSRLLRRVGVGNVYLWVCAVYALVGLGLLGVFEGVLPLPAVGAVFACNLVNFLLLDSVVAPTYQVLIKLVPPRHSDGTRMIMEGGFMLLGGLLGAGLTALHAHAWVSLGGLFALLALLSALFALAGWRLKKSYTEVLIRAVREQDIDVEDERTMDSLGALMSTALEVPRGLLLHRDDGVRQLGIEILRRHPGPGAAQVCLPLLEHQNPRIRGAALEALDSRGAAGALERILPRLRDEDTEVRRCAAQLIGRTLEGEGELEGARRRALIEALSPHLAAAAGHAALQVEIVYILEKLRDEDSAARRRIALQTLLDSEQVEEIVAGIELLDKLGAGAPGRLVGFLRHPHPAVREAAVGALGAGGEEEFATLLEMLADPDPDVVERTTEVLGRTTDRARRQAMLAALDRRPLREWEGLVLALLERDDPAAAPEIMASCRRRLVEANRYLAGIECLRQEGAQAALSLLADQLRLQVRTVQNGVIRVLGRLGDVEVVNDLVERLGAEDEAGRENAIELLENIGDRELLAHLLPLLEAETEEGRKAAQRLGGWEKVSLEEVLGYGLGRPDIWTQMAALWAAATLGAGHLLAKLPPERAPQIREIIAQIQTRRGGETMAGEDLPLTTMEKITFLKESSFFAALPLEELYHIALSVQEESVRAGAAVIREGSLGDKMYIVVRGELEVRKSAGEGGEQRLAALGPKQVFGEMALLDDEPRSASVVALEEAHLLSLQRSDLERILRRYSSIAFNMMRMLSRRLRESMAA